jgi:hypothetical protein
MNDRRIVHLAAYRPPNGQTLAQPVEVLQEAAAATCKMAGKLDPIKPDPVALESLALQADALRVAALRAAQAARAGGPRGAA